MNQKPLNSSQDLATSVCNQRRLGAKDRKRFGLVWEEKPEDVVDLCSNYLPVLKEDHRKAISGPNNQPTNILIEGDNFHALSVLSYTHSGKIDVIYIDPPFNTGATDWKYNNNYVDSKDAYRHSKWIQMMAVRLRLARNLLSEKGFFICAIDHHELGNLLLLCDELFGESNRIGNVAVIHKPEGRQFAKFFTPSYENMLIYAKNKNLANFNRIALYKDTAKKFNLTDKQGRYYLKSCIRTDGDADRYPNRFYPVYVSKDLNNITLDFREDYHELWPLVNSSKRIWIRKKASFLEWIDNKEVVAEKTKNGDVTLKRKYRESEIFKTHWINARYNATTHGTQLLASVLGSRKFDYPKSLYLILDILKVTSKPDSVVLDFFAGSGTTGHAVMELNKEDGGNRKFILCTNNENKIAEEVAYPRIKNIIGGYKFKGKEKTILMEKNLNMALCNSLVDQVRNIKQENGQYDSFEHDFSDSKFKLLGVKNISSKKEGIPANLRYFKTDFISKHLNNIDLTREQLTSVSVEMICIKENVFNLILDEEGYKVFKNSRLHCAIIFDTDKIPAISQHFNQLADKLPLHIYIFSYNSDTYTSDFVSLKRKHQIIPVPESILEVYQRIFKKKDGGQS